MSHAVPARTRIEVETTDFSAAPKDRARIALLRTPTLLDIARVTLWRWAGQLTRHRDAIRDEAVLDAAMAIRCGDCERAASILAPTVVALALDAAYLNLYGVICESRKQWKAAGRFYGLAMSVDSKYPPARENMRRLYELNTFGHTDDSATLGDIEALQAATVRIPQKDVSSRAGSSCLN